MSDLTRYKAKRPVKIEALGEIIGVSGGKDYRGMAFVNIDVAFYEPYKGELIKFYIEPHLWRTLDAGQKVKMTLESR